MSFKIILRWFLLLLFTYLPVLLFHHSMKTEWSDKETSTSASLLTLVFTMFILPAFLLYLNAYFFRKPENRDSSIAIVFGLSVVSILLSIDLGFENWKAMSNSSADTGTIAVLKWEAIIGIGILIFGYLMGYFFTKNSGTPT